MADTIPFNSFNLIGTDSGHPIVDGVSNNQVGTTVAPLDPLLEPLQNNGGPTATHSPLAGSPALDQGANLLALPFDQRGDGFPRVIGDQAERAADCTRGAWLDYDR